MSKTKLLEFTNIEISFDDVSSVQRMLSETFYDDSFNKINYMNIKKNSDMNLPKLKLSNQNGSLEFISINKNKANSISEEEFFEIIGVTTKGISKRSGKYQEKLYGLYLVAKSKNDKGFMKDIFDKAIVFKNNLNYVKMLTQKPLFRKNWRKNYGNISPVKMFKDTGNLRIFNIIAE